MFDFNYNRAVAKNIQDRCKHYAEYIDIVAQHALLTKKMFALSQDLHIDEWVLSASLVCDLILKSTTCYSNRNCTLRRSVATAIKS